MLKLGELRMSPRSALALILATAVGVPTAVEAHPGGLDADGCHHNRKTGDYHCHRGARASSAGSDSTRPPGLVSAGGAFRNCSEARAAGAAPVYRGSAGYGPHLDRDGDGVACEPYRGR